MKKIVEDHVGDLILWSFCVLALGAYVLTVLKAQADQTLGNVLMAALGALGGYMTKRITAGDQSTNVDTATNVEVNPIEEPDGERVQTDG